MINGQNALFPPMGEGATSIEMLVRKCASRGGVVGVVGDLVVIGVWDKVSQHWETYSWDAKNGCFTFLSVMDEVPNSSPFSVNEYTPQQRNLPLYTT